MQEQFQEWRRNNPSGFFVNCKSANDLMLHRANCWHHGDTQTGPEEWGSLTAKLKVCSTNRRELEEWAEKWALTHGKAPLNLKLCSDCKL